MRGARETCLLFLAILGGCVALLFADAVAVEMSTSPQPRPAAIVRLSLEEALALFLRQNLDLIIAKYGIDSAQGQAITARLFPNPVLSVGALGSWTQGRTLSNSGQIYPQVQQLFEMAGKRGYRIESAAYGIQGAEAAFEDAIRQLSFTLKETYYRVQLGLRRLSLAEENRDRFARILEINTVRFKKGFIAEVDLIRIRLQVVDFHSQVITALQDTESARADLRVLLQLPATTKVELTTDMEYRRLDPDVRAMQQLALDGRPDIRVKRIARAQRSADLKLAQSYRYPDVTIGEATPYRELKDLTIPNSSGSASGFRSRCSTAIKAGSRRARSMCRSRRPISERRSSRLRTKSISPTAT